MLFLLKQTIDYKEKAMKFRLLSWEDGLNEGEFETLEEAKEYVRENDMDVTIYDMTAGTYQRYNLNRAAKEQRETEYDVTQTILGFGDES